MTSVVLAKAADPETIALISAGAAIVGGLIGGGLGYRGVVKQMDAQRSLDSAQHRRQTYADFLAVALEHLRALGPLGFREADWKEFIPRYEARLAALYLVGSKKVRARAAALVQVMDEVMKEVVEAVRGDEEESEIGSVLATGVNQEAQLKVVATHEADVRDAISAVTEAMREDLRGR